MPTNLTPSVTMMNLPIATSLISRLYEVLRPRVATLIGLERTVMPV